MGGLEVLLAFVVSDISPRITSSLDASQKEVSFRGEIRPPFGKADRLVSFALIAVLRSSLIFLSRGGPLEVAATVAE